MQISIYNKNDYVHQKLPAIIEINTYKIIFDINYKFDSVGKTIEEILDMSKDEHVRRLGINTGELAYTYFTTPENNKEINKLLKIIYIVYTF
jgi:hypothetical protein